MLTNKKLLVRGNLNEGMIETLHQRFPGMELVVARYDDATIREHIRDAHVIYGPVAKELFVEAVNLEYIHVGNQGVQWAYYPELKNSDVTITNAYGVWSPAMAEHIVMLSLALLRGLKPHVVGMADRVWRPKGVDYACLRGKTVVFIGAGTIAQACAPLFLAFGCTTVAVGRTGTPDERFDRVHTVDSLADAVGEGDILVNALPSTPDTEGLIGVDIIARMKPTALFINVGRGNTVDEHALIAALQEGRLGGAGIDVAQVEPLPDDNPLWTLDNVIVTGHTSGTAGDMRAISFELLLENLTRYHEGRDLLHVVDKQRGY